MASGTLTDLVVRKQEFGVALRPSNAVNNISLAGGTAENITIPAGAKAVMLKGTDNFFVNFTTTAAVPGDVTNGQASELIVSPQIFDIDGVSNISVIASSACLVNAAFFG